MNDGAEETVCGQIQAEPDFDLILSSLADKSMLAETFRELEVGDAVAPVSRDARELSALVAIADLADKALDLGRARDVAIWRARYYAVPLERVAEVAGVSRSTVYRWSREIEDTVETVDAGTYDYGTRGNVNYLRCAECHTELSGTHAFIGELFAAMVVHWRDSPACEPTEDSHGSPPPPEPSKLAGSTKNIKSLIELTGLGDLYDYDDEIPIWSHDETSVRTALSEISDALPSISESRPLPTDKSRELVSKLAERLANNVTDLDKRSERSVLELNLLRTIAGLAAGASDLRLARDLAIWRGPQPRGATGENRGGGTSERANRQAVEQQDGRDPDAGCQLLQAVRATPIRLYTVPRNSLYTVPRNSRYTVPRNSRYPVRIRGSRGLAETLGPRNDGTDGRRVPAGVAKVYVPGRDGLASQCHLRLVPRNKVAAENALTPQPDRQPTHPDHLSRDPEPPRALRRLR